MRPHKALLQAARTVCRGCLGSGVSHVGGKMCPCQRAEFDRKMADFLEVHGTDANNY